MPPGTLVTFHAHPDDEAISTGGTMARAAARGHRVVLVVATGGELGEVAPGVLAPGESLADRRRRETESAARILGVARVVHLGYRDSGMAGDDSNGAADCFRQADVDAAGSALAAVLVEERATALTIYDPNGAYGHPDHIQVHRVGLVAAKLAGLGEVFMATLNRDHLGATMDAAAALGTEIPGGIDRDDLGRIGVSADEVTHAVDVRPWLAAKRAAMAAHASQIPPESFFLASDAATFEAVFGTEWYVRHEIDPALVEPAVAAELFPGR